MTTKNVTYAKRLALAQVAREIVAKRNSGEPITDDEWQSLADLSRSGYDRPPNQTVLDMFEAGKKDAEIATAVGCSTQAVWAARKRWKGKQ